MSQILRPTICTTPVIRFSRKRPNNLTTTISSQLNTKIDYNTTWNRRLLTTTTTTTTAPSAVTVSAASSNNNTVTAATSSTESGRSGSSSFRTSSSYNYVTTFGVALASLSIGYGIGRITAWNPNPNGNTYVVPNGLPRTCCEDDGHHHPNNDNNDNTNKMSNKQYTEEQKALPMKLRKIVGKENIILDGTEQTTTTMPYLKGSRLGSGTALCIVSPTKLQEVIDIVQEVVNCNCTVLVQGQNTGLTGGSVPRDNNTNNTNHDHYHRPTVIISMKKLNRLFPIDDGQRVVCLAGVGLASLQQFLQQYFPDRESHSILGSTFLNPTVAAGVAFGSGGTQCRKGPAYTERALYLKVTTNKWNEKIVTVINTLGIEGMEDMYDTNDPDKIIKRGKSGSVANKIDKWSRWITEGYVRDMKYSSKTNPNGTNIASDRTYAQRLCDNSSDPKRVSRYNADTTGPEYCRSEGKVIILASVHDTFPRPYRTKTYWIGLDSFETAGKFRTDVCLQNAEELPISIEYLDRDAFDIINRSGRFLGSVIKLTGTSSSLVRQLWNIKLYIEALPFVSAPYIVDKLLHTINNIVPSILPKPIMDIGTTMDHHIAITIGDFEGPTSNNKETNSMDRIVKRMEEFQKKYGTDKVRIYECQSKHDVNSISAFRFVAAPAFRTWCIGEGVQGFSIDYALPIRSSGIIPPVPGDKITNNKKDPDQSNSSIIIPLPIKRMRYSHFGCNVVHEDIAYDVGVDIHTMKHAIKDVIEHTCHGKLPAEHGHGTEYIAPPDTQQRWQAMDPLNVLNPGIGGLSTNYKYQ